MNVALYLSFLPVLNKSPPAKWVMSPNLLQKTKCSLILGLFQTGELGLELVFSGHMVGKEVVKCDSGSDVIDVVYFLTIIGGERILDSLTKLAQLRFGYSN